MWPLHSKISTVAGWKGQDCSSSLYTRRWRPKDPKKLSWMESLHGFLVHTKYKQCDVDFENLCQACLQEVGLMQNLGDHVSGSSFEWESRALAITWSQTSACVWSGPKAWKLSSMGLEWVMFRSTYQGGRMKTASAMHIPEIAIPINAWIGIRDSKLA